MRKLLHLPRLEYVSIQNQGDFLLEVPVEMTDVPKVCLDCFYMLHFLPTFVMHAVIWTFKFV